METNKIVILLVDDKNLHLDLIKMKLINLGYSNIVTRNTYDSGVEYLDTHIPDLVILDYYLDKSNTGIKLVKECLLNTDIPVIFISSFYGEDVFREILNVLPMSFISKNASEFELDKTIKLSMAKVDVANLNRKICEFIFVRFGKLIKKLAVADVEYLEVDGKYLNLYAENKKFLVRSTLNDFLQMLPDNFIKVHQAYVVNLKFLESVSLDDGTLKVGQVTVPFSRNHKKEIFKAYYHP
jgi:two-component system, LytTR family, response regulator